MVQAGKPPAGCMVSEKMGKVLHRYRVAHCQENDSRESHTAHTRNHKTIVCMYVCTYLRTIQIHTHESIKTHVHTYVPTS
jgi:hypothetical protein